MLSLLGTFFHSRFLGSSKRLHSSPFLKMESSDFDDKKVFKLDLAMLIMGILTEFKEFLKEYKVVGLAIALIIGLAATSLVKSTVDNLIMPIITPFIPGGGWQTATFSIGPIVIGWGALLGEVINFVVIAFIVFIIAKYMLKEEKVTKK
jgi:large conductance mechanosensitive channel